jgi:hypothetical protein
MYLSRKDSVGVLLWRSCLDFEGHRSMVGIADSEDLGDFRGEGSCKSLVRGVGNKLALYLLLRLDHGIVAAQAVAGRRKDRR